MSPLIKAVVLSFILVVGVVHSRDQQRTVKVILALLSGSKCPATVVVSDRSPAAEQSLYTQELVHTFMRMHSNPIILAEVNTFNQKRPSSRLICQDAVIFGDQIDQLDSIYRQTKTYFDVHNAWVVASFTRHDAARLLFEIQNEHLFVLLETRGRDLELGSWRANNQTSFTIIGSQSNVKRTTLLGRPSDLAGRHLVIGTLSFPPATIIDAAGNVEGIEPSILETLSRSLKFTYSFSPTSPNEMWGEIFDNDTITGLLGMLVYQQVDLASGGLYLSSIRLAFIDYTDVYDIAYESFLVPAAPPYAKWTALIYSFTWPTWLATIASAGVVIVMLRWVAACSFAPRAAGAVPHDVFADWQYCCLYVVGNLSNVQMQPQTIRSTSNRIFLIGWLLATLILSTGYRSGLISYMTFPFTPPSIDTLQQLVDSPLEKIVYGGFLKSSLMNSTNELEKKIGKQLVPHYNLTGMFVSLQTGSLAVQSNLNNILYMATTMYPTTSAGPRVHLIPKNVLPNWVGFGLPKHSQLKPYFDKEIQRLIESGLIVHHRTRFAKKLDQWNPKKANDRISFSLDNLQGAFYLLTVGLVTSTLVFVLEICFTLNIFKIRPK